MLKVLKYDLKAIGKYLITLYGVMLGLGLVVRIFDVLSEKFEIFNIAYAFMFFVFMVVVILSVLLTGIFTVKHYMTNLFKDEGYLTHTLPVSKNKLLLSKVLMALISIIMTGIVILISLFIDFCNNEVLLVIQNLWNVNFMGIELYKLVLVVLGYAILAYMTTILMIYAGIALGFSKNGNKMIMAIIFTIMLYAIMQVINVIYLVILILVEPSFMINLVNGTFDMLDIVTFLGSFSLILIIYFGIFYFITWKWMEKRLNLE